MTTQSQPDSGPPETTKFKLNAPRLIAGTLAAVTGAALSSRLGVAGTLVGTAVISLISGTAATVYEHSVERGRVAVRNRLSALEDNGAFGRLKPARAQSADETGTIGHDTGPLPAAAGNAGPGRLRTAVAGLLHSPGRRWALAAAGALATFVVALGIVTVIEVTHGSSLSGTGHQTTLGQAFSGSGHNGPQQEHRQPTPSGSPGSSSPTPSATPSPGPSSSESPSSSPSSDTPSSGTPTPSATPSQQSTQAPTTNEPTTNPPTTEPPASDPSQAPTSGVPSPRPSE